MALGRRLGALLGLLVAVGLHAPAAASERPLTFFDATRELRGDLGPRATEAALDEMDALGVDVVRYIVYWSDVAPAPRSRGLPLFFNPSDASHYSSGLRAVDGLVRGAHARGMAVLLTPSGKWPNGDVPDWARRPSGEPSPARFGELMQALGRRYGGRFDPDGPFGPETPLPRVQFMSIWNEPNSAVFLRAAGGPSRAPQLYRRLVVAGRHGLARGGWRGRLLIGDTASPTGAMSLDPAAFMREVLCLVFESRNAVPTTSCPQLAANGWAHHPYGLVSPIGGRRLRVSDRVLNRVSRVLARARQVGALPARTRLYVTEYGYHDRSPRPRVADRRQAELLALAELIGRLTPGVMSFAQYQLRDDPPSYGRAGLRSGLRRWDAEPVGCKHAGARCKASHGAFRLPLAAYRRGGRAVTLWGRVRPAEGPTWVTILIRDRRGKARPWRNVRTSESGEIWLRARYRRGRRWALAWGPAKGPFVSAWRLRFAR